MQMPELTDRYTDTAGKQPCEIKKGNNREQEIRSRRRHAVQCGFLWETSRALKVNNYKLVDHINMLFDPAKLPVKKLECLEESGHTSSWVRSCLRSNEVSC